MRIRRRLRAKTSSQVSKAGGYGLVLETLVRAEFAGVSSTRPQPRRHVIVRELIWLFSSGCYRRPSTLTPAASGVSIHVRCECEASTASATTWAFQPS